MSRNFNGTTDELFLAAGGMAGATHGTFAAIFRVDDTAAFRTIYGIVTSGGVFIEAPMQINGTDQMTWNGNTFGAAIPMNTWLCLVIRKATGSVLARMSYYRYDTGAWVHTPIDAAEPNLTAIGGTNLITPATDGTGGEGFDGDLALLAGWNNHLPWAADAAGDAALEQSGIQWDLLAWLNARGHQTPPSFAAAGAGAITEASGGALSPASPATVDAGQLLIIFAYYEGVATAPSTPTGFTLLDGPRTLASSVGRCWVFGKIADGTEDGAANALGTPAVTTMRAARCYSFNNVRADTIANVVGGFGFDGPASAATINDVGVTTPEANCLAVNLITVADDNALVAFTGETGGDWTEAIAEFTSAATTPDYAQGINTAPLPAAGTINGGAQTMGAVDPWGVVGFYIRPAAGGAAANPPTHLNLFDQSAVAQTVIDLTGNGSNEAAGRVGTTVGTSEPPGFGYGADLIASPGHAASSSGFTVDPATLALTGVDVTFGGTSSAAITVDTAVLALSALTPTFAGTGAATRTVDTAQLSLSAPDVAFGPSTSAPLPVDTAQLALTGLTPTLAGSGVAAAVVDTGALALTGLTPTFVGTAAASLIPHYLAISDFGPNFTTPDQPQFALGTELAVRMKLRMTDWTPAGSTHQFGQAAVGGDGNWSWVFSIHPSGVPRLAVWPTGSSASLIGPEPDTPFPGVNGQELCIGATVELNIGSNQRRFYYEYSLDNGVTWLPLHSQNGGFIVETGATSFFNSTAVLGSPGTFGSGANAFWWVKLWSDAARTTLIANPDWSTVPLGATSHVDSVGLTWTHGTFTAMAEGDPAALRLSGVDVAMGGTASAAIAVDPAILVLSGLEPTISLAAGLNVDPGIGTLSGITPTLAGTGVGSWAVDTGSLPLVAITPAFAGTGAVAALVDTAVAVLAGLTPTLAGSSAAFLAVDPSILVLSGPDVAFGAGAAERIVDTATLALSALNVAFAGTGASALPVDVAGVTFTAQTPALAGTGVAATVVDPATLLLAGVDVPLVLPIEVVVDPAVLVLVGVTPTLTTEEAPIPPWTTLRAVAWIVDLAGVGPEPELVAAGQGGLVEHTLKIGDVRTLRYDLRRDLTGVIEVRFVVAAELGDPTIIDRAGVIIDVPTGIVDLSILAGDYGAGLLEMSARYPRRRPFLLEARTGPTPVTHPNRGQEILWLEPALP